MDIFNTEKTAKLEKQLEAAHDEVGRLRIEVEGGLSRERELIAKSARLNRNAEEQELRAQRAEASLAAITNPGAGALAKAGVAKFGSKCVKWSAIREWDLNFAETHVVSVTVNGSISVSPPMPLAQFMAEREFGLTRHRGSRVDTDEATDEARMSEPEIR